MPVTGIYIVTLNNEAPISVNAHDSRRPGAIRVTRDNCKVGKARNFEARRANYQKTFGKSNVNFYPIAELQDIARAETYILARLRDYRVGRNEWLLGIDAHEVERIVLSAIEDCGVPYRVIGSVSAR